MLFFQYLILFYSLKFRDDPKMFTRLAHEAGAVYKIGGKMVRIKRSIFEAYLRKIQADI